MRSNIESHTYKKSCGHIMTNPPASIDESTGLPSSEPSSLPSRLPTSLPTALPTSLPTASPSLFPTTFPSGTCLALFYYFSITSYTSEKNNSLRRHYQTKSTQSKPASFWVKTTDRLRVSVPRLRVSVPRLPKP